MAHSTWLRASALVLLLAGAALAFLVADSSIAVDETIPAPQVLDAQLERPAADEPAVFLRVRWRPVRDVETYRVWREVMVFSGYDSTGTLVELDEPVLAWIPWGAVDAVPGVDPVEALFAPLDGDEGARYGISACLQGDEDLTCSPMSLVAISPTPTGVAPTTWGRAKRRAVESAPR